MRIAPWLLLAVTGCSGLENFLPARPDGGQLKVPGSFRDARTTPGHREHLALTGKDQLSCHDCHAVADAGFHAQAVKPCAECHREQQAQHHPLDGGIAMTCFSCHIFRSQDSPEPIDRWSCRRCHLEQTDGGAPRGPAVGTANPHHLPPQIGIHKVRCNRCHRPHEKPFTKAADCGLCHDVIASHGKGEKALSTDTCMTCHPHHRPAALAQGLCITCHTKDTMAVSARVKPGALFDGGHSACSTCHPPHAFVASEVKNCQACHASKPVLAADKHSECTQCHKPHEPRSEAKQCTSCHTKLHVEHPEDAEGRSCLGCHPVHDQHTVTVEQALAVPCSKCHHQAPFDKVVHASSVACRDCHQQPHLGKPKRKGLCISCHETQTSAVKTTAGHQDCGKCHLSLPHQHGTAPKACLECHPQKKPPQSGHSECESCHQNHSGKVQKVCLDCHNTPLPGLHAVAKHQDCRSCHAAHTPEPGPGPASCQKCHTKLSLQSHPTRPAQCVSCHLFVNKR